MASGIYGISGINGIQIDGFSVRVPHRADGMRMDTSTISWLSWATKRSRVFWQDVVGTEMPTRGPVISVWASVVNGQLFRRKQRHWVRRQLARKAHKPTLNHNCTVTSYI
jgi:hypothetical protein